MEDKKYSIEEMAQFLFQDDCKDIPKEKLPLFVSLGIVAFAIGFVNFLFNKHDELRRK